MRVHSGASASIPTEPVFVFGSNLAGRHGRGAALWARQNRGAIYGVGIGRQGNSYGIPTKGYQMESLPLTRIEHHVAEFVSYARAHPDLRFQLTPIGCGLAGFSPEQIAPMFLYSPANVELPDEFMPVLTRILATEATTANSVGTERSEVHHETGEQP
jgi:hypothetical protein